MARSITEDEKRYAQELLQKARAAMIAVEDYHQARVDKLCQAVAWATANEKTFTRLANMSVEESGLGDLAGRPNMPPGLRKNEAILWPKTKRWSGAWPRFRRERISLQSGCTGRLLSGSPIHRYAFAPASSQMCRATAHALRMTIRCVLTRLTPVA
jgi:hypothetical protein